MKDISIFFQEGVDKNLLDEQKTFRWLEAVWQHLKLEDGWVHFIFCNDAQLHEMNLKFLSHDTLTDILTFDLSAGMESTEAEIYISVERVTENALDFQRVFDEELRRVMAHGLLHLAGYKDGTESQKSKMRTKEEECILMFQG